MTPEEVTADHYRKIAAIQNHLHERERQLGMELPLLDLWQLPGGGKSERAEYHRRSAEIKADFNREYDVEGARFKKAIRKALKRRKE